jgi:hypothetical protein
VERAAPAPPFDGAPKKAEQERAEGFPQDRREGQMYSNGHMVTAEDGGSRNFYMMGFPDADQARHKIDVMFPTPHGAYVLAPLSETTLAHHEVMQGQIWLCCTMEEKTGKETSSGFDPKGRGKKKIRG